MYCSNCGSEIDKRAVVCTNCGTQVGNSVAGVVDKGGFLWGVLGCCIPIVGLILFLVWNDTKPKTAKAAGMGALISVGSILLFYVLVILTGVGVGLSGF